MAHLSLLADIDKTEEKIKDSVTLMTVHSAKGLEFDTVFITGLEEGLFPSLRNDVDDDIEEERRLFYVAITRAKRTLYITHANDRIRFGMHEMKMKSRFLHEIPEECIEESNPVSFRDKKLKDLESSIERRKNDFYISKNSGTETARPRLKSDNIVPGDKIVHKAWGLGTVVQIKGDVVVIAFENKGIKNLNLEYAPIEKI